MKIAFNDYIINQKLSPAIAKIYDRLDSIKKLTKLTDTNDKRSRFCMGILVASQLDMIRDSAYIVSENIDPKDKNIKAKKEVKA